MIRRFLVFLLAISISTTIVSCTQKNRGNSIGKEDSVRKAPPPEGAAETQDNSNSPSNAAPADNTARETADTTVSQP